MTINFEGVKVALRQDKNGFILTLSIHPDEIPEDLLRDFVGSRYGVAMVRIGDDEKPYDRSNGRHPAVVAAGQMCRSTDFQTYMFVKMMSESTSEEHCAEKLCDLLGISSRSELATNEKARELFYNLDRKFAAYQSEVANVPF